jgi:hypothetical protein
LKCHRTKKRRAPSTAQSASSLARENLLTAQVQTDGRAFQNLHAGENYLVQQWYQTASIFWQKNSIKEPFYLDLSIVTASGSVKDVKGVLSA